MAVAIEESLKLRHTKLRVFRMLEPMLKDDKDRERFALFLKNMPWGYARDVPPELIASHWKLLRNISENGKEISAKMRLQNEIADSWIGGPELDDVPAVFKRLDPENKSPLLRSYFHLEDAFSVQLAYAQQALGGKSIEPPAWLEKLKEFGESDGNITFNATILEDITLIRAEVTNSSRLTVMRKMCEILLLHRIQPASFELWSDFRKPEDNRRTKERHSVEITIKEPLDDDIIESLKADFKRYLVALLKVHSLFDIIGPPMVGPSSSHTAGAARIGQLSRNILLAMQQAGMFKKINQIGVTLVGSFRDSGPGHGTHIAIGAGLKGLSPDSPMLKSEGALDTLEKNGIPWTDGLSVRFSGFVAAERHLDDKYIAHAGDCTNIAIVTAVVDDGVKHELVGFSTGGSLVEIRFLDDKRLQPAIIGKADFWISADAVDDADASVIKLSSEEKNGWGRIHKIYSQLPPRSDIVPAFNTFEEVLEECRDTGKDLFDIAIELETSLQNTTREQIIELMTSFWYVMKSSVIGGLESLKRTTMNLSGGDAKKLHNYIKKQKYESLHTLASVYALASSETNAQMGRIVACPTAGACGIIPGTLLAWQEIYESWGNDAREIEKDIVKALIIAAFVGMIFYDDIPTAGATLGCQAEIGVGAAMAAAAIVQLNGGTPEDVVHGAILALKNCMGLVCDPVAGLVEVPCIKRNAVYSSVAITAANMAMAGIRSQIPPDEVVLAVKEVGENMHSNYKETAKGGLACTLNGKEISRRFGEMCHGLFCSGCGMR